MARKVKALVPYYGAARMTGPKIGKLVGPCSYLLAPTCGSCAEFPYIKASSIMAADLHEDVVNLGRVVSGDRERFRRFFGRVLGRLHSEAEFQSALRAMKARRTPGLYEPAADAAPNEERAADYFTVCWMGRSSVPGTAQEARNTFSFRNESGGGDSAFRYFSAVRSMRDWRTILSHTTFMRERAHEMISRFNESALGDRVKETRRFRTLYLDPPWFDAGDDYLYPMTDLQHAGLAQQVTITAKLGMRVVVRINDHPMTRGLYPPALWIYRELDGRDQANAKKKELVLIAREGWRLPDDGE